MSNSYSIPAHAIYREIDEKAIVLNLDTGQYYSLNEMATRMWALLQEKDSTAAIIEALEAEYDVDHDQVTADLELFLADLQKNGLVEQN